MLHTSKLVTRWNSLKRLNEAWTLIAARLTVITKNAKIKLLTRIKTKLVSEIACACVKFETKITALTFFNVGHNNKKSPPGNVKTRIDVLYFMAILTSCLPRRSQEGQGGNGHRQISRISYRFVLWEAVYHTKHCCSRKVKIFDWWKVHELGMYCQSACIAVNGNPS